MEPAQNTEPGVDEAFELLRRLFGGQQGESQDTYLPLLRTLRRLSGLRDAMRDAADDVLEYASSSYGSILASVMRHTSESSSEELSRLTNQKPATSVIELRIMAAQLHGWLESVVNKLEAAHEAEQALGMPLGEMLERATLTVPAPSDDETESRAHTHAQVGMYL